MASEIKRRFTDTEMQIAKETDLPELLTHLGYQVRRIGRYHTTVEMDSLRIKDRRKWFRYSQNMWIGTPVCGAMPLPAAAPMFQKAA